MLQSSWTRLLYAVGYVLIVLLASLSMGDFAQDLLGSIIVGNPCGDQEDCQVYGYLSASRLTFALSVYHGILAIITLGVTNSRHPRAKYHNRYWSVKFLCLLALVVGFWFIPNSFYLGYGYLALCGAFIFAVAQFVLLVSFADSLNAYFVGMYEESSSNSFIARLILLTFLFFGLAFTLIIMLYVFFAGAGCGLNIFFTTFTLVFTVIASILSMLPAVQELRPNIGIFQSSVVGAYAAFLTWISVSGQPDETFPNCGAEKNEYFSRLIALVAGSIFLASSIFFWVFMQNTESAGENQPLLASETAAVQEEPVSEDDDETTVTVYSYSTFHAILACATLYLVMMITNWTVLVRNENNSEYQLSSGLPAMWLKWTAAALSLLLYTWSLVAPVIFPERDFS